MKSRVIFTILFLAGITLQAAENGSKEINVSSKKHGWIGVGIQDVTPRFARENDLKIKEGAYINDVVDDSPAYSSGLKEGDVILEFNKKKIETSEDLMDAVRETDPGTKADVKIDRKGDQKSITLTVGKLKMRRPFSVSVPHGPVMAFDFTNDDIEGMKLLELHKQLGEYFEAPNGKGVLVQEVEEDENAAQAGIKAGDVIVKLGDKSIKDVGDVYDAVSDLDEGNNVKVELLRKGKKTIVTLNISEREENEDHIFWRGHAPDNFNLRLGPKMEKLHRELELRMEELPRRGEKSLKEIEIRMKDKEI